MPEYKLREKRKDDKTFEGEFDIISRSEKAIKLWDGEGTIQDAKWVPFSQIVRIDKTNKVDAVEVEMLEWIAKEKRFV